MAKLNKPTLNLYNVARQRDDAASWRALAEHLLGDAAKPSKRKVKRTKKEKIMWPCPVVEVTFGDGTTMRMSVSVPQKLAGKPEGVSEALERGARMMRLIREREVGGSPRVTSCRIVPSLFSTRTLVAEQELVDAAERIAA